LFDNLIEQCFMDGDPDLLAHSMTVQGGVIRGLRVEKIDFALSNKRRVSSGVMDPGQDAFEGKLL
jgi:hypothetical protein